MTDLAEAKEQDVPVQLPGWLQEVLPAPRQPHRLTAPLEDGKRVLRMTAPDGTFKDFADLPSLGEDKRTNRIDLSAEDDGVYEHFSRGERYLSYPIEGGYFGMILLHTDDDRRQSLERSYREALEAQKGYLENPKSFLHAWRFIDRHPAFWTASNLEDHPWYWETEGYCSKLRQWIFEAEDGSYTIQLEGGGHIERSTGPGYLPYSEHYGDWRVSSTGESFEAAIIELAYRVSKSFDGEGNSLPKESFPYEEPQWIKDLSDRLEEDGADSEDES